jgi:hypothetical protein
MEFNLQSFKIHVRCAVYKTTSNLSEYSKSCDIKHWMILKALLTGNWLIVNMMIKWVIYWFFYCIVTCVPIDRQRFGKHIPVQANACNSRTSVAGQQHGKHALSTIQAVFSMGSMSRGNKRTQSEDATKYRTVMSGRIELSSRCQPARIWAWNWIELAVAD